MAIGARAAVPLLALLVLAALLPGAAAVSYEGPGQKGVVPVGEGGTTVSSLAGIADDHLFVAFEGVPGDVCRLVLDGNGTYAGTGVTWAPGEETAYVWAAPGGRDVPYRLHAAWTTDLKGNCTVERTETETHWHDPEGRPYVALRVLEDRPVLEGPAGEPIAVRFTLHNNGTIADNVTARVAVLHDSFRASSAGPVVDVVVGPGEEVPFVFDVDVPWEAKPRTYVVQIDFTADSGWRQGATALLKVGPPVGPGPTPTETVDPRDTEPLAPPTVEPQEAALPFWVVVAALGVAALRRPMALTRAGRG